MAYNLAPLQNLIDQFERMQGIGHKTAQRMAFYVLGLSDNEANDFAKAITDAHTKIKQCKICCDLADDDLCPICKSNDRDTMFSTGLYHLWIISDLTKSE